VSGGAHLAPGATDGGRQQHPVTGLEPTHPGPDLEDLPDCLVAERYPTSSLNPYPA
jgi:hypothetical protein